MPTNRNLPRLLKSRLLTVATVDKAKKMAPVPPAAMAIREPPLEKPRATCRMRDSISPMKKVKPNSRATPQPLSLVRSMPYMKPQAMPRKSMKAMNGLLARKLNLIWMPASAPNTVGTMERPNNR